MFGVSSAWRVRPSIFGLTSMSRHDANVTSMIKHDVASGVLSGHGRYDSRTLMMTQPEGIGQVVK
jgi:hypothetical protein